jgi:hypothetical protein
MAQDTGDAAAVVLSVREQSFAVMDLSVPGKVGGPEVDRDLRELERWTGWVLGQPTVKAAAGMTSCQARIVSGGLVEGALSDAIWPLVAALAPHGRVSVTVIGAPVMTAPMTVDNRFVHMEQSGGQGVQSYQALIKDPSFSTLDELKRPEAAASREARPRRSLAGAWLLLVVASAAVGAAVYLITRGARQGRSGAVHLRRR